MANSVERYYQKKKRRKKKAKVVFFSLLFVLMMLTLAILSVTVFFNAETILVEGNTHYTAEAILEQGGLSVGQNLFRLDKFEVIEKMQELPYIKTVTIHRKLPNTLSVKIVENQPVVWTKTANGVALLNEEYRVLELLDIPEEMLPALPEVSIPEQPKEETTGDEEEPKEEETKEEETKEEETTEEESEEPMADESEEPAEEEPVVYEGLKGVPALTPLTATSLEVGKPAVFAEEEDYTGFLKVLYESFTQTPDLQWNLLNEVRFTARYDIKLVYNERITIDLGTLERAETNLERAAYMLKENGSAQTAILDVTDPERVYYRPKK